MCVNLHRPGFTSVQQAGKHKSEGCSSFQIYIPDTNMVDSVFQDKPKTFLEINEYRADLLPLLGQKHRRLLLFCPAWLLCVTPQSCRATYGSTSARDKRHNQIPFPRAAGDPSERPQVVGAIQDEALRRGKQRQDWLCSRWRGGG